MVPEALPFTFNNLATIEAIVDAVRAMPNDTVDEKWKKIAEALYAWLFIYSRFPQAGPFSEIVTTAKTVLEQYIPKKMKFENFKKKPISVRSLVCGLGIRAVGFIPMALTYDLRDDDDLYLVEVNNQCAAKTFSIVFIDDKGNQKFWNAIPMEAITSVLMIHYRPLGFKFAGWESVVEKGKFIPDSEIRDSVSAWHKVFGSVNEYLKEFDKERKKEKARKTSQSTSSNS